MFFPEAMVTRSEILVRGMVQGVGFRPFVYSQASRHDLRGRVRNNTIGVWIEVEGNHDDIENFVSDLRSNAPPLSTVESLECNHNLAPADYSDFVILESANEGEQFVPISADVGTCGDCLRELFDPQDRRYQYPFINCTSCGPRFTIIQDIPYDRARTTMRDFEMCAACRAEYEDPFDRRFHAEPTACAVCGPQLYLLNADGLEVGRDTGAETEIIDRVRDLLLKGRIIAIKGIGGFHLACDALSQEAVAELRTRKYREDKPFAMMADSVNIVRQHCFVSRAESQLLQSERRPVLLLEKKPDSTIPSAVAPGVNALGFMLPYTPLHHLLLRNLDRPLVMTSGNVSSEPICYENAEATKRLHKIADYFVFHDRRIHMRTDDSVVRVYDNREMILRRSRGYAPAPIKTAFKFERQLLACGAELKSTFCLTRDNYAFVSHHVGDLENLETLGSFVEGITHFKRLFHLEPEVVAYDLHPEYLSTKYALSQSESLTKVAVQHHHAHIASCMVDNQIEGEVIGVAMDGLGFGTDGRMWGGEFFVADFAAAERIAHLAYVPMPGGANAIRQPWRMAAVYLQQAFGDEFLELNLPCVKGMERRGWPTLRIMAATHTNSPETSSMGRLFDAVSSIIGVRDTVNYEGQAAIELEGIADLHCAEAYEFGLSRDSAGDVIDARDVIRRAVTDLLEGVPPATVSARFHLSVARLIVAVAESVRSERRLNRVVLSGGVFQNLLLLERTCEMLRSKGFQVITHSRVPTNDGGISLGQAAVANALIKSGRI
ncbi:MAG: carbamoyltransferase HypF [Pyrinomonadaceae bacterium]|nr:carbamoyltransferase HypF [Pyrinomonadaceae bacterium]